MSHNGRVRVLAITALVMCASCGATERSKRAAPKKRPPETARVEFPSGVFAITNARVVVDRCNGRVRFETTVLEIDMAASVVVSAPDNHPYEAVLDRGELVARGAFNKSRFCQTYRQLEIWRLTDQGDGSLSGYRTTYWRDARTARRGDCLEACKVVFGVEAVRSEDDGEPELELNSKPLSRAARGGSRRR